MKPKNPLPLFLFLIALEKKRPKKALGASKHSLKNSHSDLNIFVHFGFVFSKRLGASENKQ